MRRRTLIAGLGSAVAWAMVARAQPAERMRRIDVVMSANESGTAENSQLQTH
jgi:hypothetical protein